MAKCSVDGPCVRVTGPGRPQVLESSTDPPPVVAFAAEPLSTLVVAAAAPPSVVAAACRFLRAAELPPLAYAAHWITYVVAEASWGEGEHSYREGQSSGGAYSARDGANQALRVGVWDEQGDRCRLSYAQSRKRQQGQSGGNHV